MNFAARRSVEVAAYGEELGVDHGDKALRSQAEIVERSIETGDPRATNFAEACVREFRHNRNEYLAAAQDWAMRLHRAKAWSPGTSIGECPVPC